jgi:alpha-tubulin suppressor-like RCC1 family protein
LRIDSVLSPWQSLGILMLLFTAPLGAARIDPVAVAVGDRHALALKVIEGEAFVWAWGSNTYGQLGHDPGETPHQFYPEFIADLPITIRALCAGADHNLALDDTGRVWSWGRNDFGQLGDGTFVDRFTPLPITDSNSLVMTAVTAGAHFSMALDENGTVWAWGDNRRRQIGPLVQAFQTAIPTQVTGALGVVASDLCAGRDHGLAVAESQVYGWGRGTEGQLTLGLWIDRNQPVWIPDLSEVNEVAAGTAHSLALDPNGRVHAWGLNEYGQLGDGSFITPGEPVLPFTDPNVVIDTLAAGSGHSLARDSTGTVWAWGDNRSGQVGNGEPNDAIPSPVPVLMQDVHAVTLAAGDTYNLALDSRGLAWEWGQLDVNDVNDISEPTPVQVPDFPCVLDLRSADGGTVAEPNLGIWIYRLSEKIPLRAVPEAHHHFRSWSGSAVDSGLVDEVNDPNTALLIQGDQTLSAHFDPNQYTLILESSAGGRVTSPGEGSFTYTHDPPIALAVVRDSDDTSFERWELLAGAGVFENEHTGNTTFTIAADSRIKAHFVTATSAGLVDPLRTVVARELEHGHGIVTENPNTGDMALLETLNASDANIVDLTGLDRAVNLHTLNLNDNRVSDVNVLTNMPALRTLLLDRNDAPDVAALVTMTQLTTLHLSGNPLADYAPFGALVNLEHLVLNDTNDTIEDIPAAWLSQLTQLQVLSVRGNNGLRKSDPNVRRLLTEVCWPNGGGIAVDR